MKGWRKHVVVRVASSPLVHERPLTRQRLLIPRTLPSSKPLALLKMCHTLMQPYPRFTRKNSAVARLSAATLQSKTNSTCSREAVLHHPERSFRSL